MALYKRGKTWWASFSHGGQRIQRTTGTTDYLKAKEYHDKLKAELWDITKLNNRAVYSWQNAVVRWLKEGQHKRTLECDKMHLRWLNSHLKNYHLHEITRDLLCHIADKKLAEGVSATTVNRMLEVVRAILRKAQQEWEWIDKVPSVRMLHVEKSRVRWLTHSEAKRLLLELPQHLRDMAAFTLATGLRASNVTGMQWCDIDLKNRHAWVHPDEAKAKKAIPVPLNDDAVAILQQRHNNGSSYVFLYKGNRIKQCNTRAWRLALERAGIKSFRWHDLRHTWASWHVQHGTSLQELQQLGGWSSFEMVLRYAHLSSDHLRCAANRITATEMKSGAAI